LIRRPGLICPGLFTFRSRMLRSNSQIDCLAIASHGFEPCRAEFRFSARPHLRIRINSVEEGGSSLIGRHGPCCNCTTICRGSQNVRHPYTRRHCQTSGIYRVVKEGDGATTFQVTCVEGEHFPPARSGKGAHYELVLAATHFHKHEELGSRDS
jgi:hypothetical protein